MRDVIVVRYQWKDESGSVAQNNRYLPDSLSAPAAMARAAALAARLQAISSARLISYQLIWFLDPLGPATATAPANPHGVLFYTTPTAGQVFNVVVPGIRPEFILSPDPTDSPVLYIDTSTPEVVALNDEIINGGWVNPSLYDITALDSAYIQYRTYGQIFVP